MFGIHLKRGSEKIVAVADIGSGSAALALVAVPKTGPVRLLTVKRSILSLEERSPQAIASAIGAHLLEPVSKCLATTTKMEVRSLNRSMRSYAPLGHALKQSGLTRTFLKRHGLLAQ